MVEKNQIVYWINGFPNNGFGIYKGKEFLGKRHIVKLFTGETIKCDAVQDLEKTIKSKEETINQLEPRKMELPSDLVFILLTNKDHLETAKFLLANGHSNNK